MWGSSRDCLWFLVSCSLVILVHGNFTFDGFYLPSSMLCLGQAHVFENGTLSLINSTNPRQTAGVAYYPDPIRMKDPATTKLASFNTSFTFQEDPQFWNGSGYIYRGDGMAFVMVGSDNWVGGVAGRLGIFSDQGQPKVVAVEFDNYRTDYIDDVNMYDDHVGIDVQSPISKLNVSVATLGISFWKRNVLTTWIEYDGTNKIIQVRVANTSSRPTSPLLNYSIDLYDQVDEYMWVGFSGANGDAWCLYHIYNWTFSSFGVPPATSKPGLNVGLIVGVCVGVLVVLCLAAFGVYLFFDRKARAKELEENKKMLEMPGMPEYITYKHLSVATKQFSDQSKLGQGGFGSVYRGVLPRSGAAVAVKKVSSDSKQGEREFLAEVSIISQLRHRNVVQLMGYCRDRGKFLLVYELMPNGSLDKALFSPRGPEFVLSWDQRWKIVSGTAAALHYLHEGWRQQVIHRDVKASNIMLDDEFNAKLGDFGLARLVDHHKDAATTLVAGTYGYIAPEAAGGKFTEKTDVYAFGAVTLEVACGRKAFDGSAPAHELILVDKVWNALEEGDLLSVVDPRLQDEFDIYNMEVVLLIGLLCSHPDPSARPSMRQVVQVLAGDAPVPSVPSSKPAPTFGANQSWISIHDLRKSATTDQTTSQTSRELRSAGPSSSVSLSSQLLPTDLHPR